MNLSAGTLGGAAVAAVWVVAVAGAGRAVTELGEWYRRLRKPPWQPPDYLFPVAWTTIFLLAGVALALAWRQGSAGDRAWLAATYALNGVLNFAWSVLFFRRRRPDRALVEVVPLWLSIAAMIGVVGRLSPAGAWMLAPYLAWVSFAAVLNRAIVRLNGPFHPL